MLILDSVTGEPVDEPPATGQIAPAAGSTGGAVAARPSRIREQIAGGWIIAQKSEHTRRAYRRDLEAYFAWCDEFGIDVFAAQRVHIDAYRDSIADRSDATQARMLSVVSSYYRYGMSEREDVVRDNPVARVRNRPRGSADSTTEFLDDAEAARFIAAADELGPLEAAFARIMLVTGPRSAEIAGARANDLRTVDGVLTFTVRRKGGKTARIPLPDGAADVLRRYLAGRTSGPLIPNRRGGTMNRNQVDYLVKRIARAAGVSTKKISAHSLRHTAATTARKAGRDMRDVQELLGHTRSDTTARYEHAYTVRTSAAHDIEHYLGSLNPAEGRPALS